MAQRDVYNGNRPSITKRKKINTKRAAEGARTVKSNVAPKTGSASKSAPSIQRGYQKSAPSIQRGYQKSAKNYNADTNMAHSIRRGTLSTGNNNSNDVVDNIMKRLKTKKGVK